MGLTRISWGPGFWLVAAMALASGASSADDAQSPPEFANDRHLSAHASQLLTWVVASHDAANKPFAVVDKRAARVFVFGADGQLRGESPVLLGAALGDQSAASVGGYAGGWIAPQDRTTPAGRFDSVPGHNDKGEAIVWVDYRAAVAVHRLRPSPPAERRAERLASDAPDDNRISLGCIVVRAAFYDTVVEPTLGRQRGVVYVMPETTDWQAVFLAGQAAL